MNSSTLYEYVEAYAFKIGSNYRDIRRCRDDLLDFMDANAWFEQTVKGIGDEIYLVDMKSINPKLELWLKGYGQQDKEKLELLLSHFSNKYPETCGFFRKFMEIEEIRSTTMLRVLDFVLSSTNGEITDYDDRKIQELLDLSNDCLGTDARVQLIRFVNELRKRNLHIAWSYKIVNSGGKKKNNDAFTIENYAKMAYWTFAPEAWENRGFVKKAAASEKCAKLWLYIALHFVCALRKTDLERLPVPMIYEQKGKLKNRILEGGYSELEAINLVEGWMFLIETLAMKPRKTADYRGVPSLKVFIPESLKREFGIILALAACHHKDGDSFVDVYAERNLIETFFGEEFASASGTRYFRSRQANKAFLQGIEVSADNVPGKPKGYMLASLARSHKGGIGTLSEITDIYLSDENFTGYKPEFILREMFDRGIFGFIPVILLERYAGVQYRRLGVANQTRLIQEVGLSAYQIEELTVCMRRSLNDAEELVQSLLADSSREQLKQGLQLIVTEGAPGKEQGIYCVRNAMGYNCISQDRSSCIGCGYEVYTKSALQLLLREYRNLLYRKQMAEGFEKTRLAGILKNGVMPAIAEIVTSIPVLYPEADMKPLEMMLERGMKYVAISEDGGL